MPAYSIEGYLIALRSRSTHTVCVEGADDLMVVRHCLLQFVGDKDPLNRAYVIDSMDIVKSDGTTPGNSEKLKKICALLNGTTFSDKVTALSDREYERFDIDKPEIDLGPFHINPYGHLHYTRGHSIENYFFEPEYFVRYIEFNHATALTANHRQLLNSNWDRILVQTASLTYAIHEYHYCTKTKGLFAFRHWQHVGSDKLEIDECAIESSLSSRSIPREHSDKILTRARLLQTVFSTRLAASRWIIHGHVGLDLLCGAIGRVMAICGVKLSTCEAVNGYSDIKLKYFASQWFDKAKSSNDLFPVTFFERIISAIED